LRRYEIAVWRELGWVLVHLAHQSFPARFGRVPELLVHCVDPGQQWAVKWIVVGQQVRTGWYRVEHLEVLDLILGVIVARLELGAGHAVLAVFQRIPAAT